MADNKLVQELQAVEETIARLRGLLSGAELDASLKPLLDKQSALQAQIGVVTKDSHLSTGDRGVAGSSASGHLVTGDQNKIASTIIEHQTVVHPGAPLPLSFDHETALDRYLAHIIEANRRLQLQGIRSAGELISIELEQVYITLTATIRQRRADVDEAWLKESAGLAPGESRRRVAAGGDDLTAVPVQQALANHAWLVVLGDPGCGKTTLLRYLALTYARDWAGESGLVKRRLNLAERRLPILLPLRDFARHLAKNHPDPGLDGPVLLLDYLRTFFKNQGIALPDSFFADRLQAGECAVLLDGLDEVADLPTRYRIARIIERFTTAYEKTIDNLTQTESKNNRYVVTSRLVGYTNSARLGVDYAVTRVRDFSDRDIENFVTHWNLAVELTLARSAGSGLTAAEAESEARRRAARQSETLLTAINSNERVRELAVNPLLLTVIALVQRYRAQLPERRTELYEEAIEVLLGQWDVAKGLPEQNHVVGRALDAGDRRSLLEPLALTMMEQQWREIEADELKQQLARQFATMMSDKREVAKAVAAFVRLISERSGLLVERGYGVVSFSHLTFQEHLAARAVADLDDYLDYTLARLDDSWWREVILLEAGYLSTQGKKRVTALIRAIMDQRTEPVLFHNLVLAAECVRDVGAVRLEGDLTAEIRRRIQRQFKRPLKNNEQIKTEVERRAAAAEALARIENGSSGLQPAFWRQPYGEPVWVTVPAGEFWLGSDNMDDDEKPLHRVYLPVFQIARTPITNAQYQIFVQAAKHKAPGHWTDNRAPKGKESHPVVNVSLDDTLAYCNWLSEFSSKRITLPSEAEWEKAARGGNDQRVYPWGDKWDTAMCNNRRLGLEDTTPVGIFPEGASPYGCLDMCGNVWEWTHSVFKDYPYNSEHECEHQDDLRWILRGGSFSISVQCTRCTFRFMRDPADKGLNFGFRVVSKPG
ncbi:MAG: Hercynine oxygenase [Anaerolineae bacterium]|nr:Hercynine oxygenase [Anaerolineae bacterium]